MLKKIDENKTPEVLVSVYSSAAQHCFYIGEKQNYKKSLIDSATVFADSCLNVAVRNKIETGLSDAYYILGHVSKRNKEYDKAIIYFKKALLDKRSKADKTEFNIYSSLGKLFLEIKNYKLATLYLDTCKSLPISNELDCPISIADFEYNLYKEKGEYNKALESLEKLIVLRKAIQDNEKNKTINDLETKYQTELKETKIEKLNQKVEIDTLRIRSLFAFSALAILIIVIIIFFYRQSTIKNKLNTIEIEQRLNRARMNPHFFFNAMASLQNLSLSIDKRELVPSFISKFAKIMRQSLESTFAELDTIENEIAFLTDYLELQKLLSDNKFKYDFKLSDDIEPNELLVPGMILQPFIENSIEHGFKNMSQEGLIVLDFILESNFLKITITDNGKGINDDVKHKAYPSRATQIIRDRLFLLNKTYKTNATFTLSNLENSKGIIVEIFLPVIYKT